MRRRSGEPVAVSVDSTDYDDLSRWRWHALVGRDSNPKYATRMDGSQRVLMHRYLMGLGFGDPLQVDHINRNGLDNRRSNLRIVTRAGNRQNLPSFPNTSSRFRGVYWDKDRQLWRVVCRLNRKHFRLGRFKSEEEAGVVAAAWRATHMPLSPD